MSATGAVASGSRRSPQRPTDSGPTHITCIDPADGADGVFRDACVMVRLSAPADPTTLSPSTFRVEDREGTVPARLRLSPDRLVLIWMADRLLAPGVAHIVHSDGLRDARGQEVAPHRSRFIPCDLISTDWPP
jgi:hypothetical protein